MYIYSFEKLEVWNEAKEFAKSIYTITSTVSICSNIAEGSARNSYKDKAHFTTMAFGSTVEVLNQLILCFELNFITESDYLKLRCDIESITNKLNALRSFQITKSTEAK